MHIVTRNVNSAFRSMVEAFDSGMSVVRKPYSNPNGSGFTLAIDEPVTITYKQPKERVLFNSARDLNPFFALYESLWMLAGRNDVESLAYYCSKIARFSDDGETFNGAYGYRWRHADGYGSKDENDNVDQLNLIVKQLKDNPNSRQAVLAMWNVEDDLLKTGKSKDICCNLMVKFKVREQKLDITVFNRSNDLILGTLGNDYVVFSFLQEYMAARLGIEVGVYHQISDDMHVYENNWKPKDWIESYEGYDNFYHKNFKSDWESVPFIENPDVFEKELIEFVEVNSKFTTDPMYRVYWEEPFLANVAQPMCYAFHFHKEKDYQGALYRCGEIKADDWRLACTQWLKKRSMKSAKENEV